MIIIDPRLDHITKSKKVCNTTTSKITPQAPRLTPYKPLHNSFIDSNPIIRIDETPNPNDLQELPIFKNEISVDDIDDYYKIFSHSKNQASKVYSQIGPLGSSHKLSKLHLRKVLQPSHISKNRIITTPIKLSKENLIRENQLANVSRNHPKNSTRYYSTSKKKTTNNSNNTNNISNDKNLTFLPKINSMNDVQSEYVPLVERDNTTTSDKSMNKANHKFVKLNGIGDKVYGENIDKVYEKNLGRGYHKSADKLYENSMDNSYEKGLNKSYEKVMDRPYNKDKSYEKAMNKSHERAMDRPYDKDKSYEKAIDKSHEKVMDKPYDKDKSYEKVMDKLYDKDKPYDKDRSYEKSIEKLYEKVMEKSYDKALDKSYDKITDKSYDKSMDKSNDRSMERVSDKSIMKINDKQQQQQQQLIDKSIDKSMYSSGDDKVFFKNNLLSKKHYVEILTDIKTSKRDINTNSNNNSTRSIEDNLYQNINLDVIYKELQRYQPQNCSKNPKSGLSTFIKAGTSHLNKEKSRLIDQEKDLLRRLIIMSANYKKTDLKKIEDEILKQKNHQCKKQKFKHWTTPTPHHAHHQHQHQNHCALHATNTTHGINLESTGTYPSPSPLHVVYTLPPAHPDIVHNSNDIYSMHTNPDPPITTHGRYNILIAPQNIHNSSSNNNNNNNPDPTTQPYHTIHPISSTHAINSSTHTSKAILESKNFPNLRDSDDNANLSWDSEHLVLLSSTKDLVFNKKLLNHSSQNYTFLTQDTSGLLNMNQDISNTPNIISTSNSKALHQIQTPINASSPRLPIRKKSLEYDNTRKSAKTPYATMRMLNHKKKMNSILAVDHIIKSCKELKENDEECNMLIEKNKLMLEKMQEINENMQIINSHHAEITHLNPEDFIFLRNCEKYWDDYKKKDAQSLRDKIRETSAFIVKHRLHRKLPRSRGFQIDINGLE